MKSPKRARTQYSDPEFGAGRSSTSTIVPMVPQRTCDGLYALEDVGHAELKTAGTFTFPGFVKFVAVEKPATEAHQGVNPFTRNQ
jgi:hypothetical protein